MRLYDNMFIMCLYDVFVCVYMIICVYMCLYDVCVYLRLCVYMHLYDVFHMHLYDNVCLYAST